MTFALPSRSRFLVACTLLVTSAGCLLPSKHPAPVPSPSASVRPIVPLILPTSPLSGLPAAKGSPVLVVKIDNSEASHPQVGLNDADIVYMEPVEGGITRLAAVFSTHIPAAVGPIRSARENDVELLGAYGRVPLAFSGANRGVVGIVDSSALVDASYDRETSAYHRDFRRPAPYNLFADGHQLVAGAAGTDGARDVGLSFGASSGGSPVSAMETRVASVRVDFAYDDASQRWALTLDGIPSYLAEGGPVSAANVIVQFVRVGSSRFSDVNGNPSPFSDTIGTGKAVVFHDGRRFDGSWARSSQSSVTRFLDAQRHDIQLRTGTTWILLAAVGNVLSATPAPSQINESGASRAS